MASKKPIWIIKNNQELRAFEDDFNELLDKYEESGIELKDYIDFFETLIFYWRLRQLVGWAGGSFESLEACFKADRKGD